MNIMESKNVLSPAQKGEAQNILKQLGGDGHNPDAGFFEGAEKLIEMWFQTSSHSKSLRSISREKIDWLLTFVKCTVISVLKGAQFDAYLLSESSLFIFDDLVILKTCGTTTLLHFMPEFMKVALDECGLKTLQGLWFSRKNMYRPQLQAGVHQHFHDEVQFLDEHLAKYNLTGGAYLLGRLNGDHWKLYALDAPCWEQEVELTFELLMSDLDQDRMKELFYCKESDPAELQRLGKECSQKSGISKMLEGVELDESMFFPCGYSMNGIREREYYTIHVTPQPECSYASFETNRYYENYDSVIRQLVEIFRPGRFIVNLYSQNGNPPVISKNIDDFTRRDWVEYEFTRNTMHMGHYVKVKNYARTQSSLSLVENYAHQPEGNSQ